MMEHVWKPKRLAIEAVVEREELQLRAGPVAAAHVRMLAAAMDSGAEVPPIRVARLGRALCVVDGFHRLAAARSLGLDGIEALVAPMSREAARAYAMTANVTHGRNLTGKDRARIFGAYLEAGRHLDDLGDVKSSRAISAELEGMYSHTHVMRKLRDHGIEPNRGRDSAEGSRWNSEPWDDEGEDVDDDDGGEGVGPLDAVRGAEVVRHLGAIGPLYFSLGDHHRGLALGAVRELLGRLEANVAPSPSEVVVMDI